MAVGSDVQVQSPAWVSVNVAPELIGREQELAEIGAALRSHQLVTLVGWGGMGKTSLALAVAHHSAGLFANGVRFISLAEVTTLERLLLTLAKALDVNLQPAPA